MFILLAALLGIAWVLGFLVFHVASRTIHVVFGLALLSVALHFVRVRSRLT
jgi:multisubunit Na+/H+ antiporter MnhC subunit